MHPLSLHSANIGNEMEGLKDCQASDIAHFHVENKAIRVDKQAIQAGRTCLMKQAYWATVTDLS